MPILPAGGWGKKDIPLLKATGDVPALIRLLGHTDSSLRSGATDALGAIGRTATGDLVAALESHDSTVRMGAADALGMLKNPAVLPVLIGRARYDTSIDVRWTALLALGEIGHPGAISCCIAMLEDPNRYVRFGAVSALRKLRWNPPDTALLAQSCIALQDWKAVRALGPATAEPLRRMLKDDDPSTRIKLIELLSQTGAPDASEGCALALEDPKDSVRYMGLISSLRCGLAAERLPLLLARRERTGPNPAAAALLNFLFLGIGYNYIGKWWGFLVFMTYMTVIVLAQLQLGPFLPYLLAYPVTALFAVQTYYEAKRIADSYEGGL